MHDIEMRKQQILTRRAELIDRLQRIDHDLDAPADPNWDDHAIELEDDEALEALGTSGIKELRGLEAALARMEAGTYGQCSLCGKPIDQARLDILPATPFCRDCAG